MNAQYNQEHCHNFKAFYTFMAGGETNCGGRASPLSIYASTARYVII